MHCIIHMCVASYHKMKKYTIKYQDKPNMHEKYINMHIFCCVTTSTLKFDMMTCQNNVLHLI